MSADFDEFRERLAALRETSTSAGIYMVTVVTLTMALAAFVFATSDEAILTESSAPIPALGIPVPLWAMYALVPLLFAGLHVAMVTKLTTLFRRSYHLVQSELGPNPELVSDRARDRVLDYGPTLGFAQEALRFYACHSGRLLVSVVDWIVVAGLPVVLVACAQVSFVRYQSIPVTLLNCLSVLIVLLSILYYNYKHTYPTSQAGRQRGARAHHYKPDPVVDRPLRGPPVIGAQATTVGPSMLIRHVFTWLSGGKPQIGHAASIVLAFFALLVCVHARPPMYFDENSRQQVWVAYEDSESIKPICYSPSLFRRAACLHLGILADTPLRGWNMPSIYAVLSALLIVSPLDGLVCPQAGYGCRAIDIRRRPIAGSVGTLNVQPPGMGAAASVRLVPNARDFAGRNLRFARFERATLDVAIWSASDLRGANFDHAIMPRTQFRDTMLNGATFRYAQIKGADFDDVSIAAISFRGATIDDGRFVDVDARGADFSLAQMSGIHIIGGTWIRACFYQATLRDAIVEMRAVDRTPKRLEAVELPPCYDVPRRLKDMPTPRLCGATPPVPNRASTLPISTSFIGAGFCRAVMHGASFVDIDLRGAGFASAILQGSYFARVDLTGADFSSADLTAGRLLQVSGGDLGLKAKPKACTVLIADDKSFESIGPSCPGRPSKEELAQAFSSCDATFYEGWKGFLLTLCEDELEFNSVVRMLSSSASSARSRYRHIAPSLAPLQQMPICLAKIMADVATCSSAQWAKDFRRQYGLVDTQPGR